MSTPDVTETLTLPAGTSPAMALKTKVFLRLVAATEGESIGYGSSASIGDSQVAHPNSSGVYTFHSVTPNSLITPSGSVYEVVVHYADGRVADARYITVTNVAGPLNVKDILTDAPASLPTAAVTTLDARTRLAYAANPDILITGAITRDSNDAPTSATVTWPDGTTGTYTATTVSTAFPGAVDAYTITYGSPATYTYTQSAVTRDTSGAVTNRPAITVS